MKDHTRAAATSVGRRRSVQIALTIASLLLFLVREPAEAGTFPASAPHAYQRGTGSPAPVSAIFAVRAPAAPYTLRIYNGGRRDIQTGDRVSSAVVTLNGATVAGPDRFNQN